MLAAGLLLTLTACDQPAAAPAASAAQSATPTATNAIVATSTWNMKDKIVKTDAEWQKELTPEEFRVLRKQGTERAFTGALWNNKESGIYTCAACGLPLFDSQHKYDSGTGWPSFWEPLKKEHVGEKEDNTLFSRRTEVHCARCGGHLGHVFDDGPRPTGLRYCINSVSLKFANRAADAKPVAGAGKTSAPGE